jgi:hypothetical protein
MTMKKLIFSIICLMGTLLFQSCSEETISRDPEDFIQLDERVYGNKVSLAKFVNNLYNFVPRGYNRLDPDPTRDNAAVSGPGPVFPNPSQYTSMVASATDEAVHATRGSASEKWGTGLWGTIAATSWDNPMKAVYTGIRRTFTYTEEIHPKIDPAKGNDKAPTAADRDLNYGQVIFIRALLNFELLKRFGGYPIVRNQLAADGNLSISKSPYDDCVKYISDLCDEAQGFLPLTYAAADFGRATKGAAFALKARLLLYAASPLNNPTSNIAKWDAAASAAAAVINLKNGAASVYSLRTGAGGSGYETFFTTLSGNTEIIFARMEGANNAIERLNGLPSIAGGLGGTNPTLDLVNDYEMITGVPFDWNNPVHRNAPFANRDPRFDKSILYNGAPWMLTTVEAFEGGKDKTGNYATRTGFYLRKFLLTTARWVAPVGNTFHCFPHYRYAEVLLNYAEAMNEAYGPDNPATYGLTARQAIALIRTRAGLTANLTVTAATSQALMRTAIRHERRIELAFEEHRHLDLRRWKTAETVLNQPVSGLKIVQTAPGVFTYTPEIVEQRVFIPKMYLYPFPQEEVSRNPSLIQNPGW